MTKATARGRETSPSFADTACSQRITVRGRTRPPSTRMLLRKVQGDEAMRWRQRAVVGVVRGGGDRARPCHQPSTLLWRN